MIATSNGAKGRTSTSTTRVGVRSTRLFSACAGRAGEHAAASRVRSDGGTHHGDNGERVGTREGRGGKEEGGRGELHGVVKRGVRCVAGYAGGSAVLGG